MLRFLTVVFRIVSYLTGVAVRSSWTQGTTFRCELMRSSGRLLERLEGAFPKVGQILSTRADLLDQPLRTSLSKLQDNVSPESNRTALSVIAASGITGKVTSISLSPIASATVAQVHVGIRSDDGRTVAIKFLRPGVRRKIIADCRIIQTLGMLIARIPQMSSIPVESAILQCANTLIMQTDFFQEAKNHFRIQQNFSENTNVIIPKLHQDLCTETVLVMDYIPGLKKISDQTLPDSVVRDALTIGIRSLYKMIFEDGIVHCDMHPGNVLIDLNGRLVILDAGFVVELTDEIRRSFAEFFLSIALRDGRTAAKIVRNTAIHVPIDLNILTFENDISRLIDKVAGSSARDFEVAGFVGELFSIMRKHKVLGTPNFTLIILSLLVFEGVTKDRHPNLEFQQEAIPFVLAALSRKTQDKKSNER